MKILHAVLSQDFYGSERYCIELATAQARADHQVTVLIQDGASHCGRAFRREVDATSAAIARDRTGGSITLAIIPRGTPAFLHRPLARRILTGVAPDIVHTHLNPAARRVGRLAQKLGIPHVATLHIRYEPREHAHCDGLICTAAWQQAALAPTFRGESAMIWVWLPAAVHTALPRVGADEVAHLRRGWTAGDGDVVFGSIGRLMPEKGMDVLLRAFRSAFPQGDEPARLVVLGHGPQAHELRRIAEGERRIRLIDAQSDIAPFYRAFDVYVSAARFEPFGLTILEAMDAGCGLVVTRTDGPREFLKDARVLWAEPNDEAALAAQLRAAAANGRQRFAYDLSPFSRKHAVEAIEQFYARVLARKGAKARV
jgi:glycosyltransferase involved in cell wall biosynthesis